MNYSKDFTSWIKTQDIKKNDLIYLKNKFQDLEEKIIKEDRR